MSRLPRTTYRLELEGRDDNPVVTPILADILRAELEGPRHGITNPAMQAVHTTVLWLWAACVRTGEYDGKFLDFKASLTNFDVLKTTEAEVQGVPPTLPGEPLSHSPADSVTPITPPPGSSSSSVTDDQASIPQPS